MRVVTSEEMGKRIKAAGDAHMPETELSCGAIQGAMILQVYQERPTLCSCVYGVLQDENGKAVDVAGIAYNGEGFFPFCGSDWLTGEHSADQAEKYIQKAADNDNQVDRLRESYGSEAPDGSANTNWLPLWMANTEIVPEILLVARELAPRDLEKLVSMHKGKDDQKKAEGGTYAKLKRYAFKKHVLIEGEKGSGKTYEVHKFANELGLHKEFIGGHEQVESIDLLGHLVQFSEKVEVETVKKGQLSLVDDNFEKATEYRTGMVWKDGPLTKAFRRAANGEETVLFVDELLRIPQRELNIFVAALTPNDNGEFMLRVPRVTSVEDGLAEEEVLICPKKNLWVVGTTNVGVGYAVDEIDEALSDRFRIIRKDTDESEMKKILLKIAEPKGLKSSVSKLMKLYASMQTLFQQGEVTKIVNLRHMAETLEMAEEEEEIPMLLEDLIPHWVERNEDGYPIQEQVSLIEKAIKRAL